MNLFKHCSFSQHVYGLPHIHGHNLELVVSEGLDVEISSLREVALSDHVHIQFSVAVNTKLS